MVGTTLTNVDNVGAALKIPADGRMLTPTTSSCAQSRSTSAGSSSARDSTSLYSSPIIEQALAGPPGLLLPPPGLEMVADRDDDDVFTHALACTAFAAAEKALEADGLEFPPGLLPSGPPPPPPHSPVLPGSMSKHRHMPKLFAISPMLHPVAPPPIEAPVSVLGGMHMQPMCLPPPPPAMQAPLAPPGFFSAPPPCVPSEPPSLTSLKLTPPVPPPPCDPVLLSAPILHLADAFPEDAAPTVGSIGHNLGTCKPCAFVHTKGCGNGTDCQFCHVCLPGEKKRRMREKRHHLRSSIHGDPACA